jgi:hypothetical protein
MASPQNASGGLPQPRIGHPTHTPAWRETTANARKTYFDEIYGGRKIELLLLGTRPEYRHRGGASKLVRWGMEMAREHEKTAVVLAGFSGTKFYLKLGFRLVGDIHIQLERRKIKWIFLLLFMSKIEGPRKYNVMAGPDSKAERDFDASEKLGKQSTCLRQFHMK